MGNSSDTDGYYIEMPIFMAITWAITGFGILGIFITASVMTALWKFVKRRIIPDYDKLKLHAEVEYVFDMSVFFIALYVGIRVSLLFNRYVSIVLIILILRFFVKKWYRNFIGL